LIGIDQRIDIGDRGIDRCTVCATKGNDNIAPNSTELIDLIQHKVLIHGCNTAPGRLAVATGSNESKCIIFLTRGIVTVHQAKGGPEHYINIGSEYFIGKRSKRGYCEQHPQYN
jgi:hypothetical protein